MDKKRILILAANPFETRPLSLDEEYQRIQKLYRKSNLKDKFELLYWPAMRGEELLQEVSEFKPHLIHFSGHGENDSLVFADASGDKRYEVTKQALAKLFKSCAPDLQAVFLNACHSAVQAEDIVAEVDYVIGMNAEINDLAAIHFSQGFYTAIFTQETLDIEKAFAAGLTQMAITQRSEKEQKKPVLQKRQKTFVPAHQYDIAVSFADADAQWTKEFTDYLQRLLNQKLYPTTKLRIYSDSGLDFAALQTAAMLLIVASPHYLQQYESQLENLKKLVKQKTSFLLETDSYTLPEGLKGLSRHKFWRDDEEQGVVSLQGDAHLAKANQVVELVAEKLKDLKNQFQHQQRLKSERHSESTKPTNIDAFVFLHSSPEDLDLIPNIIKILDENGIEYVLPLKRTDETKPEVIRQDIENNILNCDAVLILYERADAFWVRKQLTDCRHLRTRNNPLKIIAVCKDPNKPDLDLKLNNLHVYCCEAARISEFLAEFIRELA